LLLPAFFTASRPPSLKLEDDSVNELCARIGGARQPTEPKRMQGTDCENS
jgi:hypothetical protein